MPFGARCGVTTGFFVLGTCGRPAVGNCPQCERWLCADHGAAGGPCPECASAQDPASNHPLHPLWLYGRRRAYYRRSSGVFGDPGWYAGFDTFDRQGFEGHRFVGHGRSGSDGPWDADDGPFRDSDDDGYGTDS